MIEGEDLLYGDLPAGGLVESGGDGAVCALADGVEELIIIAWDRGIRDGEEGGRGSAHLFRTWGVALDFCGTTL